MRSCTFGSKQSCGCLLRVVSQLVWPRQPRSPTGAVIALRPHPSCSLCISCCRHQSVSAQHQQLRSTFSHTTSGQLGQSTMQRSAAAAGSRGSRVLHLVAAAAQQASIPAAATTGQQLKGKAVVAAFYEAYNRRDLDTIQSLIADDISYHDLVYEEPHEGKEGVMSWLEKVRGCCTIVCCPCKA